MKIGFIGLGRMGSLMVKRLIDGGHQVVGFDLDKANLAKAKEKGAETASSLEELVQKLESPKIVWVMVPHGKPTQETIGKVSTLLKKNDAIIDGGNSLYLDSMKNSQDCSKLNLHFLDVGVSGGIWGEKNGFNLMIGGEKGPFKTLEPIFKALAPQEGYAHAGAAGAGHFVKMIHNALEYAMLQAMGEAFECLKSSEFDLDLNQIAHLWQQGSVVRSWLLELLGSALEEKGNELKKIAPFVEDSDTARWTTDFAVRNAVPIPTITISLYERFASRIDGRFSAKVIAALRNQFGGHSIKDS